MSKQKVDIEDYIEQRLIHWAEWYNRGHYGGLGYPTECTLNAIRKGLTLNKQKYSSKRKMLVDEKAEEIEQLVTEMSQQHATMTQALRLHYLDHLSLRNNAKKLRVSHM